MGKLTKEEINQRLARVKGLKYELERLPDVNGEMNWSITPQTLVNRYGSLGL